MPRPGHRAVRTTRICPGARTGRTAASPIRPYRPVQGRGLGRLPCRACAARPAGRFGGFGVRVPGSDPQGVVRPAHAEGRGAFGVEYGVGDQLCGEEFGGVQERGQAVHREDQAEGAAGDGDGSGSWGMWRTYSQGRGWISGMGQLRGGWGRVSGGAVALPQPSWHDGEVRFRVPAIRNVLGTSLTVGLKFRTTQAVRVIWHPNEARRRRRWPGVTWRRGVTPRTTGAPGCRAAQAA